MNDLYLSGLATAMSALVGLLLGVPLLVPWYVYLYSRSKTQFAIFLRAKAYLTLPAHLLTAGILPFPEHYSANLSITHGQPPNYLLYWHLAGPP